MRLGEDLPQKEMDKVMADLETLQHEIEAKDAWELDRPRRDRDDEAAPASRREGRARVLRVASGAASALCRTLLEHPDLLLLDEPTNHLDVETVRWLEETLHDYKGTVVIITHDRFFLDNVVGWMLEIWHAARSRTKGNYSST
jgi:ATPase subunit of ABC transporter with duplicated ATPase domains